MSRTQEKIIELAKELEELGGSQQNLEKIISDNPDRFVSLVYKSKNDNADKIELQNLAPGTPEKILHDQIWDLAISADSLSKTTNNRRGLYRSLTEIINSNFSGL